MAIGEKIRQLREEKGWSQSELARRAGISQSGLHALEKNTKNPNVETVNLLAKALGVAVSSLLESDAQSAAKPGNSEYQLIRRNMDKMSPEDRQKTINILKAAFDDFTWDDEDA